MVRIRWTAEQGWTDARICKREPIVLDPAASVLHYGQAVFEGFKAYTQPDGGVSTFRPFDHAKRFNASLARLAMPALPVETFVEAADNLLLQDRVWVPTELEQSYYVRPFMIATEVGLGVRPASDYLFAMIGSPCGPYFSKGIQAVSVWLTDQYVRAAPGGTGAAKCSGNYAASLLAQAEAKQEGCDQVLWTDPIEHRYVEEMGGMNVCFVFRVGKDPVLVTPSLDSGTLLAGMTRASILALSADAGLRTEERLVSTEEIFLRMKEGSMLEAFACGTAAVITPIDRFKSRHGTWSLEQSGLGPVAQGLRAELLAIQYGRSADRHGWMHKVL